MCCQFVRCAVVVQQWAGAPLRVCVCTRGSRAGRGAGVAPRVSPGGLRGHGRVQRGGRVLGLVPRVSGGGASLNVFWGGVEAGSGAALGAEDRARLLVWLGRALGLEGMDCCICAHGPAPPRSHLCEHQVVLRARHTASMCCGSGRVA